jgi:hypothetical protein
MDSDTPTLRFRRTLHREAGNTLLLALVSIGVILLVGGNALRLAGNRLASVSQSTSWTRAYFLAESGVDVARDTLRTAQVDPTIWATQTFTDSGGVSSGWTPTDATTFPKTASITLPALDGESGLLSRVKVRIEKPIGPGTINPAGAGLSAAYLVRATGSLDVPGPIRISRDSVETNLRKVGWKYDWRTGQSLSGINPRASRTLEAVLRPVTPFVAALIADSTIEIKKGSGKLVDSWNSQNVDTSQRKYLKPDSDKYKGARDVGNIASNGVSDKKKAINDVIRLEGAVIWGDVYAGDATKVKIKPTPKLLTDVVKGGDIIDDFYMKLDPVPPLAGNPNWAAPAKVVKANPGSAKTPLMFETSSDPANPTKIKFTELHLHSGDQVVFKPSVDASGVVQPKSYVDIWVSNSLRIHKGGYVRLGQGVTARIFVDKCIHLESASKIGGIAYADFDVNAAGLLQIDGKTGVEKFSALTVDQAESALFASTGDLAIYGALNKKKKSHAKISAEMMGTIYAPRHDFEMKFKDSTYMNLYGSFVGRKFKIEGKTQVHYDESLANTGVATDFALASMVEDWYDRSGGK